MDDLEAIRRLGADVPVRDAFAESRALDRLRAHALSPERSLVAVAVVASAILLIGRNQSQPSAAETLRDLALVATRQPRVIAPPGKYVYVRSEELRRVGGQSIQTGEHWIALVRVTSQEWRAADGSGRILTVVRGKPRFLTPADEAAWRRGGRVPPLKPRDDERFQAGEFPVPDVRALPGDARALRRTLERRTVIAGPPGVAGTFTIIGILLAEEEVPPGLRASLLEVAAGLPGVRVIQHRLDPLGRPSLAVALSAEGRRTILDFDRSTATLLATEELGATPGARGDVLGWRALQAPRIVDSIASRGT
jgi:hypothetical protein